MKFKKLPIDYLVLCLDRLTRFKPTIDKYRRVFYDILNKFVINDTSQPFDFDHIENVVEVVSNVINNSLSDDCENDFYINNLIIDFENEAFFQDDESRKFLNNKINYKKIFCEIKKQDEVMKNLPDNLLWLILKNDDRMAVPKDLREKFSLKFPVEKVILCEGATEEILLPEFAKICGYDFKKNGVYLLGAGGKNQVGRKYLKMLEEIKLPIFILLDSDAVEIEEIISDKLRKSDDIYLIKNGEFEDILPKKLMIEAINFNFSNEHKCFECDFDDEIKMAKNLELTFKLKGFGDFKKPEFANIIKNYLNFENEQSKNPSQEFDFCEIRSIVEKIKSMEQISSANYIK